MHVVTGFAMPRSTREVPLTPARDMAWLCGGGGPRQTGRGRGGRGGEEGGRIGRGETPKIAEGGRNQIEGITENRCNGTGGSPGAQDVIDMELNGVGGLVEEEEEVEAKWLVACPESGGPRGGSIHTRWKSITGKSLCAGPFRHYHATLRW